MTRTVTLALLLCLVAVTGCRLGTATLSVSHQADDGTEYRLAWTTEELHSDYLRN